MNSQKVQVIVVSGKDSTLLAITAKITTCWSKKVWSLQWRKSQQTGNLV